MLPKQDFYPDIRIDELPTQQRLEEAPTAPMLDAYLGGQRVYLAQPQRITSGGRTRTIPISTSRLRREHDIEYGRATEPYVRSLVEDVPLDYGFSGTEETEAKRRSSTAWLIGVSVAFATLLLVAMTRRR